MKYNFLKITLEHIHKITHEYGLMLGNSCSFWVTSCLLSIILTSINSRMYKKGFHELPELQPTGGSTPTAEVIGTNTHWLSWIQPTIFQTGHKQYEQINYTLSFVEKWKIHMFSVLVCYFMLTIRCPTCKEKWRSIKHVLNKLALLTEKEGKNCHVNISLVKIWV